MAQATKEELNPIGVLIVILAALIAFGLGQDGGGGDGGGDRPPAAAENPCPPDAGLGKVVERFGKYRLRCGKAGDFGYRHIAKRHGKVTNQTYRCIGRVLARGKAIRQGKREFRYELPLGGGDWAAVIIDNRDVTTVYTKGFGDSSRRWADCLRKGG